MSGASPHSALLTAAARRQLVPMGLVQKGRYRHWVDDHHWWIVNVEFQPGGFTKGSYLNVGVQWLWKKFPAHAFEVGDRVHGLVPFESVAQFEPMADSLAGLAAERVFAYRTLFPSIDAVAGYYLELAGAASNRHGRLLKAVPESEPWAARFHGAVALALTGHAEQAAVWFTSYAAVDDGRDWVIADKAEAQSLVALLPEAVAFRQAIETTIATMRSTLRLRAESGPMFTVPVTT